MPLIPGTRLGPYQILAPLGVGGMGEVYRARDPKLNRDVALKVLLDSVVGDPERVARFAREAQVLASLNHPHIAHLYGFEVAGGGKGVGSLSSPGADPRDQERAPTPFLVMELVEGPTLADVIAVAPGGLPLDQALSIARQIADALEAAHEQGIIHRDLKPANVKVRDDGVVKVLDFGLAKALDANASGATAGSPAAMNSPTMTRLRPGYGVAGGEPGTEMGIILGTAAYMAPEQAKGKAVDRRADIWAFGVVLHEMLTGRRLFDAEDISETLAAVLTRDVNATPLPADAPARLRALVRECLIRDPKQRLRDIGDARRVLDAIIAGAPDDVMAASAAPSTAPAVAAPPVWRRALPWALVAASLLIALAAVLMRGGSSSTAPAALTRLQVALPSGIELYTFNAWSVSLSPNGSTLAFIGVRDGIRQVFLRQLDRFEFTAVPGTSNAVSCAFSPTGRELLVGYGDSSLRRIGLFDAKNDLVAPKTGWYMGAWLPNGQVVFTKDGRLWMSGETPGSAPTQLTDAKAGSTAEEMFPVAVPGGKAVLFVSARPEAPGDSRIEALSLANKMRSVVEERASRPVLTSTGHVLFLRDGSLQAAPFDVQSLKTTGDATPVLSDLSVGRIVGESSGMMAVSETGVLAYVSTNTVRSEIVSMSRTREEEVLLVSQGPAANPRLSRDGRWLVFEEISAGLRVWDLTNRTLTGLAADRSWSLFPILSRDGKDVIFNLSNGLFRQPLDGSAKPVQIAGSGVGESATGLTPDGADVLFNKTTATSVDIYALPLAGGKERALVSTAAYKGAAQISPDGKWMAYVSNELGGGFGGFEIFVLPYPALDLPHRIKVSQAGGTQPMWNPNLKDPEIVYRNGDKMMSVRLTTTSDGPKPTTPELVFSGFYAFGAGNTIPNYSMTKDGQHFILVKQSGASLNVVLNWFETLKGVK